MNLTIGQLSSLIREEIKTFISESTSAQTSPYANEMIQAIRELDFTDIEYVSSGQFGDVYKGKWQREGGAPRAIKVLSYDEIGKKEAYLYRRVSDGRSKSDAIKKHFPNSSFYLKYSFPKYPYNSSPHIIQISTPIQFP